MRAQIKTKREIIRLMQRNANNYHNWMDIVTYADSTSGQVDAALVELINEGLIVQNLKTYILTPNGIKRKY